MSAQKEGETERKRWEICVSGAATCKIPKAVSSREVLKERLGLTGVVPYLVASLSLSNENEGIGAYNGEAEVDEDNGALGADVPRVLKKRRRKEGV